MNERTAKAVLFLKIKEVILMLIFQILLFLKLIIWLVFFIFIFDVLEKKYKSKRVKEKEFEKMEVKIETKRVLAEEIESLIKLRERVKLWKNLENIDFYEVISESKNNIYFIIYGQLEIGYYIQKHSEEEVVVEDIQILGGYVEEVYKIKKKITPYGNKCVKIILSKQDEELDAIFSSDIEFIRQESETQIFHIWKPYDKWWM